MAVYGILCTGMYYFNTEYISVGVNLMYKFLIAAVLVLISIIYFLIRTELNRMTLLVRYSGILLMPHLVMLIGSLPLWVFNMQPGNVIRRGLFTQLYGMTIVLAMAGLLYVFGHRAFWLNLYAMIAANLITIAEVIRENGFNAYWEELKTLVTTFAGETGELMEEVEIHELTFAVQIMILLLILQFRELHRFRSYYPCLILALFCYLSGFKRIGIASLAAAILLFVIIEILDRGKEKHRWLTVFLAVAAVLLAFGYIAAVRGGIFDYLEEHFELDTMGRSYLSDLIGQYYTLSPAYLGQGAGWVSRFFDNEDWTIKALHNDILQVYIDMGFWGFWAWMIAYLPFRVRSIQKIQGRKGGLICLCVTVCVLITGMTDNTIYYTYVTGAVSMAVMSYQFEALAEKQDFGYRGQLL